MQVIPPLSPVDTHGHCYQGEGGWKFELEGIKLDKEVAFFVIESALRSMGIRSFTDLERKIRSKK